MSTLNFPTNPILNQTYSFGGKTWVWNGIAWQLQAQGAINNIPIGNVTPASGAFTTLAANTLTANSITVAGNVSSANLNLSGNVSIAGNVNSALNVRGNITGTNVITGGNALASYFIGNGSQLTGIVATGGSSIDNGNSNVRIGGTNANVTVSVNNVSNVAVFTETGLSVAGNVTAANFIGNISANIIVPGANTEVLFNSNDSIGTSNVFTFNPSSNVLSVGGNVVAANFVGNGQALTSVMADRGGDSNNWNTLTQMGVYTVNRTSWSGTIGTPLDSQIFVGLLEVVNSTDTAIEQVFYPGTVDSTDVKIQWNRAYWSGTWTSWVRIVNDFQTVTGGVF